MLVSILHCFQGAYWLFPAPITFCNVFWNHLRTENWQHTKQVLCWQSRHKRHNGHNTNLDFEDWYRPIDHLRTKVLGTAWPTNTIVETNTFKYKGSLPKHLWNNIVIATTNLCMSWSLLKRTPKEEDGESYWVATCLQPHKMWNLDTLFVFCFDHPSTFFLQRRVQIRHFNVLALQHRPKFTHALHFANPSDHVDAFRPGPPTALQGFDMSPCQVSTWNTHKF